MIPEVKKWIDAGKTVTFRVHGFSMRPFLDNGRDEVILEAPDRVKLKRGDVVLAEIAPQICLAQTDSPQWRLPHAQRRWKCLWNGNLQGGECYRNRHWVPAQRTYNARPRHCKKMANILSYLDAT